MRSASYCGILFPGTRGNSGVIIVQTGEEEKWSWRRVYRHEDADRALRPIVASFNATIHTANRISSEVDASKSLTLAARAETSQNSLMSKNGQLKCKTIGQGFSFTSGLST